MDREKRFVGKGAGRMGHKDETAPVRSKIDADQRATNLGLLIEQKLGVAQASLLHPEDLILSAYAVYLDNSFRISHLPGVQVNAERAVSSLEEMTPRITSASRQQLRERYLELTGNGDYKRGELAKAIRGAREVMSANEAESMEREFARLMAGKIIVEPYLAGKSTVTLERESRQVSFRGDPIFTSLTPPKVVVEYGPGVSAAGRIGKEIGQSKARHQTIFIEKGVYVAQLLTTVAESSGLRQPRIIVHHDGIAAATQALLNAGAENKVDLVVASMVHSAGMEELSIGIENAKRMLRPGGVLALQVAKGVLPGEAEGGDILAKTLSVFGAPHEVRNEKYRQNTTGELRSVTQAIFVA